MLIFEPENHKYVSDDGSDTPWVSVTTLVSFFKQPFDAKKISERSSKKKSATNKWYGMNPVEIQNVWKAESKRATDLGTWYHNQREHDLVSCETIERHGTVLPVVKPITNDKGYKIAPSQKLIPAIYPELLVFLRSVGICGQSDLVEIVNDSIFYYRLQNQQRNQKHNLL